MGLAETPGSIVPKMSYIRPNKIQFLVFTLELCANLKIVCSSFATKVYMFNM